LREHQKEPKRYPAFLARRRTAQIARPSPQEKR
jgi:hypothetical protein